MASILNFTMNYRSDDDDEYQKCFFRAPSHTKYKKMSKFEAQIIKRCFIYILIVILFLVHMKVNFAAILDFFIQIQSSVTFISGLLC